MRHPAHDREQGSISLLLIGLCALLLLIASVTIGITQVYIEKSKLQALADQAASAVANSVETVELNAEAPQVIFTDSQISEATRTFLTDSGAYSQFNQLAIGPATGSSDSRSANVELTSYARVPMVSLVLPEGVPISAQSTARSRLQQ